MRHMSEGKLPATSVLIWGIQYYYHALVLALYGRLRKDLDQPNTEFSCAAASDQHYMQFRPHSSTETAF